MLVVVLFLVVAHMSFSAGQGEICAICSCAFVNITRVEPESESGDFITFQYKADAVEPFNLNITYESVQKYFHVDCSSENNVGQINNLDWPKLQVLGILGNFRNSKWKKLECFPGDIKKQMTVLSLSQNLISEIEDFEMDEFTNLKMLNLSQNQIQKIKKGTFSRLKFLKIADLSGNWINELENWAFYGTDLHYLNLSRNLIPHFTPDVFRGLKNLTILDLSENRLTKLPDEFGNFLPSLSWLSAKKNGFERLPELPKNLKKFDVSHNQLMDLHLAHLNLEYLDIRNNELVSLAHTNFPELKVLMGSHNNISELRELPSTRIRVLDLSYNKFEKIPDAVTSDKLPLLEELYLDGNPISNVTFPPHKEPFSVLRVLSLSRLKSVKKILKHSFRGVFPKVKYDCSRESGILIDLSHNSVKFIDEDAFKTISICQIDLSNNNLKTLPKDLLPWFEMTYINLQDNPWQCDCNIQWMLDDFLTFMYANSPRLLFGMRCSTPTRFKSKMFVFWYQKSENVFCNSGSSSFFLDLGGEKSVEIWTASAIACVLLACIISVTGIVIIVLLCSRSSKRNKSAAVQNQNHRARTKDPPIYTRIRNAPVILYNTSENARDSLGKVRERERTNYLDISGFGFRQEMGRRTDAMQSMIQRHQGNQKIQEIVMEPNIYIFSVLPIYLGKNSQEDCH